jgi:hypothetical protein
MVEGPDNDAASMTSRGLRTLLGVAVGLTAFVGGATLLWPRPDTGLQVVGDRLVGETTGYVTKVDAEDGMLHVAASIFGLRSVSVHVHRDTTILVGEKQGGLGDLLPGILVRVGYQMDGDRRVAKVIELGVAGPTPRSTPPTATPSAASVPLARAGAEGEAIDAAGAGAGPPGSVARAQASDEVPTVAAPAAGDPTESSPTSPSSARQPAPMLQPRQAATRPSRGAPDSVSPAPDPAMLPPRESVFDLSASVRDWVEAAKRRDVSAQIALYAERIGNFYGRHDVSREDVRAEKLRAFGSGETLRDTGSLDIRLEPGGRVAIIRFSKRYVVDGDRHARHGEAVQELRWRWIHASWRIVDETDAPMWSHPRGN